MVLSFIVIVCAELGASVSALGYRGRLELRTLLLGSSGVHSVSSQCVACGPKHTLHTRLMLLLACVARPAYRLQWPFSNLQPAMSKGVPVPGLRRNAT